MLELSRRECEALLAVSRIIGGSSTNSPREIFSQITNAIQEKGIVIDTVKDPERILDMKNSATIYFKDYKN